ncbi:putative bifunctional diguanylate cyclase/phosphodiesterase [Methylocaldum sp. MU1018]
MTPANQFGEKLIIIGEHNESHRAQIELILSEAGFANFLAASSGIELLDQLRRLQRSPEDIGLIILNGHLPECQVDEFCLSFSSTDEGAGIPVIVFTEVSAELDDKQMFRLAQLGRQGVSLIAKPIRGRDFIPLVNMSLTLRNERYLRRSQEEQLLNELAERKVMEARLKYLVAHDELTGLANRRSLEKKLQLAIHRCRSFDQGGALLYLDLDRFNMINDLEGHETGDRLLVAAVSLLHGTLDVDHIAARIGADEFCIFLENVKRQEALSIAERLRRALDGFHFVTGQDSYHISASIGVALLESRRLASHPSVLIAEAHQACYAAKAAGRNMVQLYDGKDTEACTRRSDILWIPLIREALTENRFFLVFQPVVRVKDGAITHYEVLIRMRGKRSDIFSPGEFIPVAERMGLIHHIDLWVVDKSIDFLASLPEHQSHISLTINLSGVAFQDQSLLPLIKQKLEMTWISASRLAFEITETATVANYQQTREMIARIRALGCHFALDDFGAGFSSFDYIKKFPVDYLKIDGQFIKNLLHDETDQVLVKAMIDIARKLGKKTIAEYVESPKVLSLLKTLGVDYAQGYLIGKPESHLLDKTAISIDDIASSAQPTQVA